MRVVELSKSFSFSINLKLSNLIDRLPLDEILPIFGFFTLSLNVTTAGGGTQAGLNVGPEKTGPRTSVFSELPASILLSVTLLIAVEFESAVLLSANSS